MAAARLQQQLASLPSQTGSPEQQRSEESEYSETEYTDELIDKILDNYTFTFKPEIRVKFKRRLQDIALCAAYSKPWAGDPRWRFTVKSARDTGPVSKYARSVLVVPALSTVALFSSKIQLSVFRLQFVLGYNWARRAPSLDYRLTTKWGDGPRIRRKERFQLSDCCLLRAKWNLEAHFPDMEGHIGGGGGIGGAQAVDVDYGGMSFEVSQLDAVLEL